MINWLKSLIKKEEPLKPKVEEKVRVPLSSLKKDQVIQLIEDGPVWSDLPSYYRVSSSGKTFTVLDKVYLKVSKKYSRGNTLIKVQSKEGQVFNLRGYRDSKVLKVS